MKPRLWSSVVFGLVVVLCMAQVAWWIIFQVDATERTEEVARLLASGQIEAAQIELGAEEARGRRFMFIAEGSTLGILVLVGIIFFYTAMIRERRMSRDHRRFLEGATHELKSPLATLRVGLESLITGSMPGEKRGRYLTGMVRELERLESGLNNLLTAAGLEGGSPLEMSEGDLAGDVRSIASAMESRFQTAEVELKLDTLDPCSIKRDSAAMSLVIHSLLDNAVKFCGRGDKVSVSLGLESEEAVLRIKDTGAGIEAGDLPLIFDRFYRGSSTPHVGGTGLGLYLARELASAHGGALHVESKGPGSGSEFTLSMPISRRTS